MSVGSDYSQRVRLYAWPGVLTETQSGFSNIGHIVLQTFHVPDDLQIPSSKNDTLSIYGGLYISLWQAGCCGKNQPHFHSQNTDRNEIHRRLGATFCSPYEYELKSLDARKIHQVFFNYTVSSTSTACSLVETLLIEGGIHRLVLPETLRFHRWTIITEFSIVLTLFATMFACSPKGPLGRRHQILQESLKRMAPISGPVTEHLQAIQKLVVELPKGKDYGLLPHIEKDAQETQKAWQVNSHDDITQKIRNSVTFIGVSSIFGVFCSGQSYRIFTSFALTTCKTSSDVASLVKEAGDVEREISRKHQNADQALTAMRSYDEGRRTLVLTTTAVGMAVLGVFKLIQLYRR